MAHDRLSDKRQWLRVRLCVVSVAIGVLLAVNAQAAPTTSAYPTRPIRLVVPFPPGSPSDVLGRIVSQQFTQALGRPLVIDNRPGAAGVIGADTVAKAAPDGYTLLMGGTGALAINPGLRSNMPYDPLRDFSPISLFAKVPFILVVSPSIPAATVQELIAILRARPRQFNYASTGVGSPPQLAAELFKSMTATDLIHIPYKGTDAAAVDLISGQTHLMFSGITVLLPHVKAGRLRALAVASDTHSPLLQQLPTLIQSGLPGFTAETWTGVLAPHATPAAIIGRLHSEIVNMVANAEVREKLLTQGAQPVGNKPDEFRAFIAAELAKWSKVIKAIGIKEE